MWVGGGLFGGDACDGAFREDFFAFPDFDGWVMVADMLVFPLFVLKKRFPSSLIIAIKPGSLHIHILDWPEDSNASDKNTANVEMPKRKILHVGGGTLPHGRDSDRSRTA